MHRSQGQCSFSGRTAPSMMLSTSHRRQATVPPRAPLLTVSQLIARLNEREASAQLRCGSGACPPYSSAVAERTEPTSHIPELPLSTYSSPHRPLVMQWLESCIRDAVRHIDEAPFLQLFLAGGLRPDRTERHNVTATVVQTPQLWNSIAEHLAQAAPDVTVLVHPLDMRLESSAQKQRIVKGQQGGMSDVLTGVTAHPRHKLHAERTMESLMHSGVAQAEFSGRVGEDCCDDEVYSQVVPFTPLGKSGRHARSSLEQEMNAQIGYWGVVVQSQQASEAQGCYVLKTVHSASPTDCQCTHFTLTRVSRGEPLAEQLATAWLI